MSKLIDSYAFMEKLHERIIEWDYTSQSGFELIEFINSILDDLPFCRVTNEFFEGMCESDDQNHS